MKFNNLLYVLAIFIALFTGCLKTDEALLAEQPLYTVAAEIDTEDTKTSVTDDGYFTWSANDQVWIHTTGGGVAGTLSAGAGTANATFTHGSYVGDMTGKAVYPYDYYHSISGNNLNVRLASSYYLGSVRENTNAVMYGVNQDGVLKFNHMAGVMRFHLKNVPAGATQFKLTLDKKINGDFTADLSATHPSISTEETLDPAEKTITLNFDALTQTSDLRLCFPLPVGTYNSLALELNSDTETLWSYSNDVTNTINRRSLVLMPTVTMGGAVDGAIENDGFDKSTYIVYPEGEKLVISGDSYWRMKPFLLSRVSNISDIELKFKMASDAKAYLFSCERPYVNNCAYLNSNGLVLRYDNRGYNVINNEIVITWDEMGVNPTDLIVMRISANNDCVIVNDKTISVPGLSAFTDIEYLFSSYYYDNDDGYAKDYSGVPGGSKLYYAKIYNASGDVIYKGYPSLAEYKDGTMQYAWKSNYANKAYYEFSRTNFDQFWVKDYSHYLAQFGGGVDIPSVNLSTNGTANSYIVSESGTYSILAVKGNSTESVGPVASAEVLWETFGTDETPAVGSLISSVSCDGDRIVFSTPQVYHEGNAVIAAKDATGTILWSWHIWLTDQPEGQVYYNNAGTMMDRNLGATSATPGDVGALGLLYQWGRKDPFLGSSSISSPIPAVSTITWPSKVSSSSSSGTIEYATINPTTFITYNSNNYDWYYTGSSSRDNTRWQSAKTIYDPCPIGWHVPDGGYNGMWSNALSSSLSYSETFDNTNKGINFSFKLGSDQTIWYPTSGYLQYSNAYLCNVGFTGMDWSVTPDSYYAYQLTFNFDGMVYPADSYPRANACAVRCVQE